MSKIAGTHYMTQEEITKLKRVSFEDMFVPVPVNFEKCLKRQYGDFMKLPPPEKQKGHHSQLPDPFTPCEHPDILHWYNRNRTN